MEVGRYCFGLIPAEPDEQAVVLADIVIDAGIPHVIVECLERV